MKSTRKVLARVGRKEPYPRKTLLLNEKLKPKRYGIHFLYQSVTEPAL